MTVSNELIDSLLADYKKPECQRRLNIDPVGQFSVGGNRRDDYCRILLFVNTPQRAWRKGYATHEGFSAHADVPSLQAERFQQFVLVARDH